MKGVDDGISSIDFFERVFGLIDDSMSKTLIVKLLGRRIGYNALWNKVCALWKPSMWLQLMDIENGYYLAKFELTSVIMRLSRKVLGLCLDITLQFSHGHRVFRLLMNSRRDS